MIFSKIDKEILISAIVIVILILFTNFIMYKFISSSEVPVKNLTGGAIIESK
jgi:hypothetical protein